jgi:hypothetical protein
MQKQPVLIEFFDLSDITAGLKHTRNFTKVMFRSLKQLTSSFKLAFDGLISIKDKAKTTELIKKYHKQKIKRDREIESELRQLGAYEFNPDLLLLNPVAGMLLSVNQAIRFFTDEAGADEIPAWMKKSQQAIIDEIGLLASLRGLFYETTPLDNLDNEDFGVSGEIHIPKNVQSDPEKEKDVLKVFKDSGIDLGQKRDKYFDEMANSLNGLREQVIVQVDILNLINDIKDIDDVKQFIKSAQKIKGFNSDDIINAFEDIESAKGNDASALFKALLDVLHTARSEGLVSLKNEINNILKNMYPSIDDLNNATHPTAPMIIEIIQAINDLFK